MLSQFTLSATKSHPAAPRSVQASSRSASAAKICAHHAASATYVAESSNGDDSLPLVLNDSTSASVQHARNEDCMATAAATTPTTHAQGPALMIEDVSISGFKTFIQRVTVGPFSRFTCVVGPNGAGKSSVIDAICFVFGSRSSALRCVCILVIHASLS